MELTKKPPTEETVEAFRFSGPLRKKQAAIRIMARMGFTYIPEEEDPPMPWRDAFPEGREALPGLVLAGQRKKHGMTQRALAEITGIPQRHLSEMENGKRPIGRDNARKLALALETDFRAFL